MSTWRWSCWRPRGDESRVRNIRPGTVGKAGGGGLRYVIDHLFELVQNSLNAKARYITVKVEEDRTADLFRLTVIDDGLGIKPSHLAHIQDAFFTTRPRGQRRLGLGLALLAAACQQAGGELKVESRYRHGTTVTATMGHAHIDRPPLGDLADLYASLMVSSHENKVLWQLEHHRDGEGYVLRKRGVLDELNVISLGERGVQDQLKALIGQKEARLGA